MKIDSSFIIISKILRQHVVEECVLWLHNISIITGVLRCDLNEGERNYNVCFYMFSFMMVCALLVATQIQFRYLSPKQVGF